MLIRKIKSNFLCSLLIGTAAASRVFNEALAKIAVNAQQGGTTDIGKCNQPIEFHRYTFTL